MILVKSGARDGQTFEDESEREKERERMRERERMKETLGGE